MGRGLSPASKSPDTLDPEEGLPVGLGVWTKAPRARGQERMTRGPILGVHECPLGLLREVGEGG